MSAIDIPAIRAAHALSAVIGRNVQLKRHGREFSGCCPFHSDKTPSFTVNDDKGFYHCFGCGAHGDLFDWMRETEGLGIREAAEKLGANALPVFVPRPAEPATGIDRTAEAIGIWRAAGPARGTAAETYLRSRGIDIAIPETIRFAMLRYGGRGEPMPCLVALIASVENKATGIQRTYLQADGRGKADVDKPKLSLGRVRGGAIRLAPAAAELVVCEGLEDGLTLQQEMGKAVWVAAGASMLPSMRFPAGVQSVVIGADGDEAGAREASKAAESFALEGRSVRVIKPLEGFKDFNAELQGVWG